MAETPAEGGLELRARLLTIPFERLLPVITGRERIRGLPETGYIRTAQVNMAMQSFELMIIDPSYSPIKTGTEMPFVPVTFEPVVELVRKVPKRKKG